MSRYHTLATKKLRAATCTAKEEELADETTEERDTRFNTAYQRDRLTVNYMQRPDYSMQLPLIISTVLFKLHYKVQKSSNYGVYRTSYFGC